MFLLRPKPPSLRLVLPSEERPLKRTLRYAELENAYLLGLLSDYSLRGLSRMGWGRFYRFGDWKSCGGIFYLDTTGLLVPTGTAPEAVAEFLRLAANHELCVKRIIGGYTWVEQMREGFGLEPSLSKTIRRLFPETGMVLTSEGLIHFREPGLRLAHISDSDRIAASSVQAMAEELDLFTTGKGYDRLVSSKRELIESKRYYVFEDAGSLVFQAYFSAYTPEVCQIQGVFVPRQFRGLGIATRCVAEMCHRCFESTKRIVLRVQKRNLPAETVYRKVGFVPFMDFLSVWYDDEERSSQTVSHQA